MTSVFSNAIWWNASSNELVSRIKKYVGEDFIQVCPGDNASELFLLHIYEITKDVRTYRLIGDKEFSVDRVKDKTIGNDFTLVFYEFTYKDEPVFVQCYAFPRSWNTMLYYVREGKTSLVEEIIKDLRKFQKVKKQAHLYGIKWINTDDLDISTFVVPKIVDEQYRKLIKPQLDSGEIFNHTLLYSPPGFGKTAYARWLCRTHLDYTFIIVNPAVLSNMKALFDVFEEANSYKPSVLFFEDIDTIGQNREMTSLQFNPYLGALLNLIDGLETETKVYIMATTNNPTSLDPALRRAGRFGIHIPFRYTKSELMTIFKNYLGKCDYEEGYGLDLSFLPNCNPSQLRAIAKFSRALSNLEHKPVSRPMIKKIYDDVSKEPVYITNFAAMGSDSIKEEGDAKASTPCEEGPAPTGVAVPCTSPSSSIV